MYWVTYFEALDYACGEVQRHFVQSDLATVSEIESLLLDASNGKTLTDISPKVQEFFRKKIDLSRFEVQLQMLLKTAYQGSKKLTSIRTVADALNQSDVVKGEVDKVLKAYLPFPVTSATAERVFSSLRRIKTFLRS